VGVVEVVIVTMMKSPRMMKETKEERLPVGAARA
jgi:hypothetical protein